MELGKTVSEREPVTFDVSQLSDREREDAASVSASFVFNRVRFEDDLQTAVAMCHGISESGELNMAMLEATEAAAEYLADKQAQPFLIIDTVSKDFDGHSSLFFTGYIGKVANTEHPVGLHLDAQGQRRAGIAVERLHWVHSFTRDSINKLETQYIQPRENTILRLQDGEYTLGIPGATFPEHENKTARQDLVAGSDILEWLNSIFVDPDDRYDFYMNIIWALRRDEKNNDLTHLDCLLVEPFISGAREELTMSQEIADTLTTYEFKKKNAQRIIEGSKGEANLALQGIKESHPRFQTRLPRTSTSYPAKVTDSLDDPYGDQVKQRLEALERYNDPLWKLLTRATQQGK